MPIKWADEPAPSRIKWADAGPQAEAEIPVSGDAPAKSWDPTRDPFDPAKMQQRARETFQAMTRDDELRKRAQEDLAAGMGIGETLMASLDYGTTALGQAAKQIGMRADKFAQPQEGDSILKRAARMLVKGGGGPSLTGDTTDADIAAYDAQVSDDAKRFEEGIGRTPTGMIGGFLGGTLPTLPLGGPAGKAGAGILRNAAQAALASGVISAATTPVTKEGDFAKQKLEQGLVGAAVGGGLSAGLQGAGKIAEEIGLGNLVRRGYNALSSRANAKPKAIEGEALAQKFGVDLTPGQVSGSKTQLAAENMARQSIFTRDNVFETDMKIADQYGDAIGRTLDKLAREGGDTATAGAAVKKSVDDTLERLQKRRARLAEADFKAVDELAKSQPIIQPDNYRAAVQRVVEENSVAPKGSDARALADAASDLLESAGDNGLAKNAIKTRRYLSQIAGGQASFAGSAGQPMQRRAATQLLQALDADIDAAAAQGGDLGELLKKANDRYRAYSQKIEGVKQGPLGKILGKDLVDTEGKGFGSVAPEQIYDKFSKLPPNHIGVALKVLSPEARQQVKRAYVQKALEAAQTPTATGGASQLSTRPTTFVAALQRNPDDKRRIAALFTPDERKELDGLMDLGRRIGDSTGKNTSETAVMAQTMGILEKLRSLGVRGLSEVAGGYLGTREIAKIMSDSGGRRALMRLKRLPPQSEEARKLAAYVGGLAAAREEGE